MRIKTTLLLVAASFLLASSVYADNDYYGRNDADSDTFLEADETVTIISDHDNDDPSNNDNQNIWFKDGVTNIAQFSDVTGANFYVPINANGGIQSLGTVTITGNSDYGDYGSQGEGVIIQSDDSANATISVIDTGNITLDGHKITLVGSELILDGGIYNSGGAVTIIDSQGLDVNSNLNVDGSAVVDGAISGTGGLGLEGFTVSDATGATTIGSTLGVSGATTLSSTLGVTGATTINSTTTIRGTTTINDNLVVNAGNEGANTITSNSNNTMSTSGGGRFQTTTAGLTALSAGSDGLTVNDTGAIQLINNNGVPDSGLKIDSTGTNVTLLNNVGTGEGLTIGATSTTLTGGTNSSSLTLQDASAVLAVGTASTPEVQVLNVTNVAGNTSVTIGGANNVSNQLLANGTSGTNIITATTTNTITGGTTNTISAGTDNFLNATLQNQLTGGTGNTITATTGDNTLNSVAGANNITGYTDNVITATTGSNSLTANAADQFNTISATGANGVNNLTANATSGSNNVEAKTNNIGVVTVNSVNTIGNAGTSTNSVTGKTNAVTATTTNTISAGTDNLLNATLQNKLTGGTGNTITATTGDNTLNSVAGANSITASTTNTITGGTGNTMTATTGDNTLNSVAGANNITGYTDNVITATTGSNSLTANAADQFNTISATGANGVNNLTANATSGSNNVEAKTNNIGVATVNSVNTIGNAGTSTNSVTGKTNAVTATTTNTISAGTDNLLNATLQNQLTGGTGNTITATTGDNTLTSVAGANNITGYTDNVITATTGSNSLTANADDQFNTISATGVNGINNMTANATSGSNNIEAYYNRMGVATANSINAIGNSSVGTRVVATGGNSYMSVVNGSASLRSGSGATASGLTSTSAANTLATDSATLNSELNGVGDDASRQNIAGASYVNRLEGNTLINGNTYINGTLVYTSNTSATTTVTSGTSILREADQATNGQMSIANDGASGATVDANGKITTGIVDQSTASFTLTNGIGNTHGLIVTEKQATLSGGTHSTSMTLNDNGATFSNSANGRPVQVHGVDDGTDDFDAVNVRQLESGVAMVAGLAALPQVEQGKRFAISGGTGIYGDQVSVAFGLSARFLENLVIKGGVSMVPSNRQCNQVGNIGVSYSW